ncbi:protein kinase domain-containing protein [Pseudomonas mosselii]|uniref:protein kinase domain-containing protein n=1 Tax=Pseudomonas mosselii TaxID=78327 RepID=UPI001F21E158|nr:protein kinase [Pseudomonas mosselii]
MNIEADINKEDFFELIGLQLIENRFRLLEEVSGGKSATSFFGVDESTGNSVFVKLLIFPRSELEAAKFRNEGRFLKDNNWHNALIKKTPAYISHGELFGGKILYLITEKIEGQLLSDWMERNFNESSLIDRLHIAYRVFGAAEHFAAFTVHRDLHPSNIILLDEEVDLHTRVPDFKVIVVDWGQSHSKLAANYAEETDDIAIIDNGMGREITTSFYNLPPETFMDWNRAGSEYSKYDSWAMGLLLYKLITGGDLFTFDNIGQVAEAMRHIDQSVQSKVQMIREFTGAKTLILQGLLYHLLVKEPSDRMSIQTARQVLWFILVEEFEPDDIGMVSRFLCSPLSFDEVKWEFFESDPLAHIY